MKVKKEKQQFTLDRSLYDDANTDRSVYKAKPGVSREVILEISKQKNEPEWMLEKRLKAFGYYNETPVPTWGPDLSKLNLDEIIYFIRPGGQEEKKWEDVPEDIKKTFEKLGIPEAEKKALAGVGAQYDSEVVYHNIKEDLKAKGVIFENMDVAVQKYPELVKKYFMTSCVPINDHKFVMLHGAVWSGGTFIYVPKNVKVGLPLQAYFRMNAESGGQFEHTLIIADEGSELEYIEGCFIKGTSIHTDKGEKIIEDIKIGDKVLTHTGKYKIVYHTQVRKYTGDLYTIKYYGDSTKKLVVTNEHPFLFVKREKDNEQNKNWKTNWGKPPELQQLDYLVMPIDKRVKSLEKRKMSIKVWSRQTRKQEDKKISIPTTAEFFRLIGYYLAEGSISKGAYLNFSFNEKETEYHDDVEYLLKKLFNIKKVHRFTYKKNHGTSLVVCSTTLCRIFEQFGKGNSNKCIPFWARLESFKKQKQLIKGYFRGDGNYYDRNHASGYKEAFRMNTTSQILATQVRDILLRLKIVSFINKRNRSHEGRKDMYTIGVTGRFLTLFGNIVGIPALAMMHNKNRASKFFIDNNYAYFPIKSIKKRKIKEVDVYNFSVEKDESYVAEGVAVHNCSAPRYTTNSLHAGCVEIFVHKNAKVKYFSIENWSKNTYNLNTKRALVDEDASIEWVSGNMGSGCTMLYPCSILRGRGAHSDSLGIAFAGPGQHQDTGAKAIHVAPNTSSIIRSRSISVGGGIAGFRGLIKVTKNAVQSTASMSCDALLLDEGSKADTYPALKIDTNDVSVAHEARIGKIGEEQLFYLMSRGMSAEQAMQLIVSGFVEPIVKALPLEYAIELSKLIELEMDGAVG